MRKSKGGKKGAGASGAADDVGEVKEVNVDAEVRKHRAENSFAQYRLVFLGWPMFMVKILFTQLLTNREQMSWRPP